MSGNRVLGGGLALALAFLLSCGGGSNSVPVPPGSAPLSVTVKDAPPAGVTVLTFEVTITGAVLQPGNVSLVPTPAKIEVKKLEVESAFLSTVNVPAGNYASLQLTVSNPELTIKNDTGNAIGSCANGAVCEIKPNASTSVTINFSPSITIMANTPAGLVVDVNLANLITNTLGVDFNAANAFTAQQLTGVGLPTGQLEELEFEGTVSNKDAANNQFILQAVEGNFTIKVDNNTEFGDFDEGSPACNTSNFACVQNGQVVEVEIKLMAGGMFLAKEVELEDNQVDDELDGVITAISSSTQFQIVVVEELRGIAGIDVGNPVNVTLAAGCAASSCFRIDDNGLTVPTVQGTLFTSALDTSQLMVGQTVQVRRGTGSSGLNVTADRVRLRMSRFTATVAGTAPPNNFTVNALPSLFTASGVSQIQVQTSSQTDFDNAPSGVSSLATGNLVSLSGLLFANTPDPILTAKKVRKR